MKAFLGAIVVGILVNEFWDLSSAPAKRIVRIAARWWARDDEERAIYSEEWCAYIDDRPGRLLKLATALGLLGAATYRASCRRIAHRVAGGATVPVLQGPRLAARTRRLGRIVASEAVGIWYLLLSSTASLVGATAIGLMLGPVWALRVVAVGLGSIALGLLWFSMTMIAFLFRDPRTDRSIHNDLRDFPVLILPPNLPDGPPSRVGTTTPGGEARLLPPCESSVTRVRPYVGDPDVRLSAESTRHRPVEIFRPYVVHRQALSWPDEQTYQSGRRPGGDRQ